MYNLIQYQPTPITEPGEIVSVDQLVSPTMGFVAQMTGRLTIKRYKYATIFADQASKLGYVYLQNTGKVEENIEVKLSFQAYSLEKGVNFKAYHTDKGVFSVQKWQQA